MTAWLLAGLLSGAGPAGQQMGELQGGLSRAERTHATVSYVPEPTIVPAGRRSVVEIHLRVEPGYHVNSHVPRSELLIPTTFALDAEETGAKAGAVEYPAGKSYRFASDAAEAGSAGEMLDVYTGAVVLRVSVTAEAGEHVLRGVLRYQACDQRACYPPQKLALLVPFTAR